jgi:uncharacterized protein
MLANEWFLDSSYAIALAATSDQLHHRATELAEELENRQRQLITTRAVLFEIGNALSKQRYREAASNLLASIESDPTIRIIEISRERYLPALALFSSRPDKDWGLTDCMSFAIMQDLRLTEALTADSHFEQAGFRALLRGI